MNSCFIIDAVRSPIGRYGGGLSQVRPDDLLAFIIKALIRRNPGADIESIEDVIAGAANQAGEDNRNVARMSALLAGLPVSVAGSTVNRLCASGMQAIMDAARSVICGEGELYIAAGVESMTRAPFVMPKASGPWSRSTEVHDTTIGWRFTNDKLATKYYPYNMGETAENIARQFNISRPEQDEYAYYSHRKYFEALADGRWQDEIVSIETTPNKDGQGLFSRDEHPRETSLITLSGLKPAFVKDGTVTAGNSSGINDGAAGLLLASEQAVKKFNLVPMARIVSMAVAGVDPAIMGIGPVPASEKALQRAGLRISDLDITEINEAFAVQAIACQRGLALNPEIVNVNGGSIALGHPLGCSGARIAVTLMHAMKQRKLRYGLATMCVGVGQGSAMIFENLMAGSQS